MNSCILTYKRRMIGKEVLKLFEETGVQPTESLICTIDRLLTDYRIDVEKSFDSPELIGRIYSEARKIYDMKSQT